MNGKRHTFERRTFWPRSTRPDLLGEVDFDRPCSNCGYNLRGLPPGTICPECGSSDGLDLYAQPLPWERKRAIAAYLSIVIRVIFRPRELARQVWAPLRIDLEAARQFRRIGLLIATITLCVIAFALTSAAIGVTRAVWCLPFDAAAIILCLHAISLDAVAFFKDKLSGTLLTRAEALAYYSSAVLALVPAQLPLLILTREMMRNGEAGILIAAATHICVLLLQLALGLRFVAWLMYETVNITAVGAVAFTLAAATRSIGSAVVLLIGVPLLVGSLAARIG